MKFPILIAVVLFISIEALACAESHSTKSLSQWMGEYQAYSGETSLAIESATAPTLASLLEANRTLTRDLSATAPRTVEEAELKSALLKQLRIERTAFLIGADSESLDFDNSKTFTLLMRQARAMHESSLTRYQAIQ